MPSQFVVLVETVLSFGHVLQSVFACKVCAAEQGGIGVVAGRAGESGASAK